MKTVPVISVQAEDFNSAHEIEVLTANRKDIGAIVTFTGLCRDENGTLEALELEHYPGMAEAEITRIAAHATERWNLLALRIIHRYGKIPAGDNIVLIVAASPHRQDAFLAADYLMDYMKSRAPFWKKEHLKNPDQKGSIAGNWVEAKSDDELALDRWQG